jgi:hypothetical protein
MNVERMILVGLAREVLVMDADAMTLNFGDKEYRVCLNAEDGSVLTGTAIQALRTHLEKNGLLDEFM